MDVVALHRRRLAHLVMAELSERNYDVYIKR